MIVIIANRGPHDFVWEDGKWIAKAASGGLLSMIEPLARQPNVAWFCCVSEPPGSEAERDALYVTAKDQTDPDLNVEIEGHACSVGPTPYNQALGDRRARAVRDYLVNTLKVASTRLRIVSYGETRPAHDNRQEVTRKLNRRVVLVAHAPGEAREPIVR